MHQHPDELHVLRGGSWVYNPGYLRASYRYRYPPDLRYYYLGFRCAAADKNSGNFCSGEVSQAIEMKGDGKMEIIEKVNLTDGSTLVWVPAGSFRMGSENGITSESPVHEVEFRSGYWIQKTQVTNEQYAKFLAACPDHRKPRFWNDPRFNEPQQPVVGVSWDDAMAYAVWAGLELPSEEQWEYAARGPENRTYPWGETLPTPGLATYGLSWSTGKPAPVGSKPAGASWCGAEDMAGNVWEWCQDTYKPYDAKKKTIA